MQLLKRLNLFFTWLHISLIKSPHYFSFIFGLLYLAIFQWGFITSGDHWAESFGEYVEGAITLGWTGFFHTGLAGYFNFIPKVLSYSYVLGPFPLQYIDYFFRWSTILFGISCISFIVHPYNRSLIKSSELRWLLAFTTLLTYYHVSSFSIINVWYIGFIPIILVSLSPHKFSSEWKQLLYAGFALAVCLTKPSLILIPLVLYRMIRFKEILLGSIILFGISLQTLLFLSSSYYADLKPEHVSLITQLKTLILGAGLMAVKTFNLYPFHIDVILAAVILTIAASYYLWKSHGLVITALIGVTYGLTLYTYFYSPDTLFVSIGHDYQNLFNDKFKLQREVMISFLILLTSILLLDKTIPRYLERVKNRKYISKLPFIVMLLLVVNMYRPIDTQSASVNLAMDNYRNDIKNHISTCMPIPPSPSWIGYLYKGGPTGSWFFQYYGQCNPINYTKVFDFNSLTKPINHAVTFTVTPDAKGSEKLQIKSLLIPIANPTPHQNRHFRLTNTQTKNYYDATIDAKTSDEQLSYASFNLSKEPLSAAYTYELSEINQPMSKAKLGRFTNNDLAYYAYLIPSPNPLDYAHNQAKRR